MTQKPKERIKKLLIPIIIVLAVSLISDAFAIQLFQNKLINQETFSVFIAPPIEEVIKAGIASLFAVLYLALRIKGKDLKFRPITWAVLAGIFSGVFFALSESLVQGESMLALGAGLYTHPIWVVGVSMGCWSLILHEDKRFLAGIYPIAVLGHISWNNYIFHPSSLTESISFLLIVAIIVAVTWRYFRSVPPSSSLKI